jgi:type VI secretion system protein VasG
MTGISSAAVFGKLNKLCYQAFEGAMVFGKLRGNPSIEFVHWLVQVLNLQDSDLHRIIRHANLDSAKVAADVTRTLDGLPRGAVAVSGISEHIETAIREAWFYATLKYGESAVRSGHIVLAMLQTPSPCAATDRHFQRIRQDQACGIDRAFRQGHRRVARRRHGRQGWHPRWRRRCARRGFGRHRPCADGQGRGAQAVLHRPDPAGPRRQDRPHRRRDEEIRQVVDVLMRRRQNNPILVGEAGVGKTAVVEGFALRIARGDVPPVLADARILSLDVGLLQAGASMKGEFENRLRSVIDEVQASPRRSSCSSTRPIRWWALAGRRAPAMRRTC